MNIYPYSRYEQILEIVESEKIIPMKEMATKLGCETDYPNLAKKVRVLEKHGYLKAFHHREKKNAKFLGLGLEGIKHTKATYPEVFEDEFWHEVVNLYSIKSLMLFKAFTHSEHTFKCDHDELRPDGILYGEKNGINFKLALETELTQKTRERVTTKIEKYLMARQFDYVLYLTCKASLFESYKKFFMEGIDQMKKISKAEAMARIMMVYTPKILHGVQTLEDAECFFKGKTQSFGEVMGEVKTEVKTEVTTESNMNKENQHEEICRQNSF